MPPTLNPVHQPITATAAPAAIAASSEFFACSILNASIAISCVAENIALQLETDVYKAVGLIESGEEEEVPTEEQEESNTEK